MTAGTPEQAAGIDPSSIAYRVHAHAFNTLTQMMAGDEWFVPLSEREAIASAVVAAIEPLIRADERAAVQEPHAPDGESSPPGLKHAVTSSRLGHALAALREIRDDTDGDTGDGDLMDRARQALDDDAAIRDNIALTRGPQADAKPRLLDEILGSFVSFGRHGQFRRSVLSDDEYQSWCQRAEPPS